MKASNNAFIINSFIEYCNQGKTDEAYNLLSLDCKNLLFKTKEEFEEKYLKVYFKTKKEYEYKAWIEEKERTIYRIEISEDLLATGGNSSKKQEDYYTVVNEDGASKLNINKYIGHIEINKDFMQNDVRITVLSKDMYLENVIYNFKVENFSNKDVSIGTLKNIDSIVLTDSNDGKYKGATWELIEEKLIVTKKNIKNISIKFLRGYNPKFNENKIIFNLVNYNYENENNYVKVEIDL